MNGEKEACCQQPAPIARVELPQFPAVAQPGKGKKRQNGQGKAESGYNSEGASAWAKRAKIEPEETAAMPRTRARRGAQALELPAKRAGRPLMKRIP